jgi:signal transduction histidine kinase
MFIKRVFLFLVMDKKSLRNIFFMGGVIQLFILQFVSAKTIGETVKGLGDVLLQIPGINTILYQIGGIDSLPSLLLAALLLMVIYSILDSFPLVGKNNKGIQWAISSIVSILAFLYIDANTIQTILANYEIMGVVLTSIIPFVIIIFFSVKLEQDNPRVASFVNPPLAIIFIFYSFYKYWNLENNVLSWIYLSTLVLSLIWLIFRKRISSMLWKYTLNTTTDELKESEKLKIQLEIRDLQAKYRNVSANERKRITNEINRLRGNL